MKREDIALAGQLVISMKEALEKLEKAVKERDNEEFITAKNEILKLQKNIDKML